MAARGQMHPAENATRFSPLNLPMCVPSLSWQNDFGFSISRDVSRTVDALREVVVLLVREEAGAHVTVLPHAGLAAEQQRRLRGGRVAGARRDV